MAHKSAKVADRMRLDIEEIAQANARMNSEGYTQNPVSLLPMDHRFHALDAWLRATLPGTDFRLEPASADASFRRYFRVFAAAGPTRIAMDAPPERENSAAFVRVAALLAEAGLNAPRVLAQDLAQGFLLLSDLGTLPYIVALREASDVGRLLGDATDALLRWQAASRAGVLPEYDEALLRRELTLFPDWYVARHLGVELTAAQRVALEGVFAAVLARNLAEPRVYVHRDYMPRNLMVCEPNPGILDFQDAVHGPISYDVASLFRDAFISWDEERVLDGTIRYWEKARKAGLPVRADFADFWRDVEWMGLQRHLKVLGIFARLKYRDGKAGYLEDEPRFVAYVRHAVGRYRELAPLGRLLDDLEGRKPQARLSF
jgi:N-acetylmuramate 1-kinase